MRALIFAVMLVACDVEAPAEPDWTEDTGAGLECAAVGCGGELVMCCLTEGSPWSLAGEPWSCWYEGPEGAILRCGDFCDLEESEAAEAELCPA